VIESNQPKKPIPPGLHGGDRRSAGARSSSQNENLKAFVADIAVKTGKGRSTAQVFIPRGELRFAREVAETFLREAEREARTTECGFGCRLLGHTCLWQGDFIEAQSNLVEALSLYDPERDREARFRFGPDTGAVARGLLALTKWQLGEVGPARALIEEAVAHAIETGHIPTLVNLFLRLEMSCPTKPSTAWKAMPRSSLLSWMAMPVSSPKRFKSRTS